MAFIFEWQKNISQVSAANVRDIVLATRMSYRIMLYLLYMDNEIISYYVEVVYVDK